MTGAPLKIELLSEICHAATRLQSATMIHRAQVRESASADADLQREADAIVVQTERLAFLVAQLRDSVGQCFARPRLMESMDLEQTIHQGATHG
jgi:site-specific recombinase